MANQGELFIVSGSKGYAFEPAPADTPSRWDAPASYPEAPGYAAGVDTSIEAAEAIEPDAATLRGKVLDTIRDRGPLTADEVATALHIDRLAIRPRCTELRHLGLLADVGLRRPNASGKRAIVWMLAPPTPPEGGITP